MPNMVGIIADDLTGATDTLSQFRAAGWPAYLVLDETPPSGLPQTGSAIGLASDSRALDREHAAKVTGTALRTLMDAGIKHIYLKIDSTMRGSVGGQIAGALDAWSQVHPGSIAIVCPSYPQMGRVVRGGNIYVNGFPLEDSTAGSDPVTPVRRSRITQIVDGAVQVGGEGDVSTLARQCRSAAPGGGIVSLNAETEEDLRKVAEVANVLHPQSLCVGSAGLARHVARMWRRDLPPVLPTAGMPISQGRLVVSVSSLSDVSLAQTRHLTAAFGATIVRYELSAMDLWDPVGIRNRCRNIAGQSDSRVVLVQPSPWLADSDDRVRSAREVARRLAIFVDALLDSDYVTGLVLVGGDGAEATLRLLGAQALELQSQVSEGVPLTRIIGGRANGLTVVTKAGAFGSGTTITDAVSTLLGITKGLL